MLEFNNLMKNANIKIKQEKDIQKNNKYDINIIKMEIEKIISRLGLIKSNDAMIQLKNCCLVQKYIVENNVYTSNDIEKNNSKENIRTINLYNAVIKHIGGCINNSIMFQEILSKIGVVVECVVLINNKTGGKHLGNLVKLDGSYYFFDSSLEKSIYDSMIKQEKFLILHCAGLGKKDYCKFYTPKFILSKDLKNKAKPLPNNISNVSIPSRIINEQIKKDDKKRTYKDIK